MVKQTESIQIGMLAAYNARKFPGDGNVAYFRRLIPTENGSRREVLTCHHNNRYYYWDHGGTAEDEGQWVEFEELGVIS